VAIITAGGSGQAVSIVQGFVDTIRSMLSFTAGPTIQPTFAPAGGAPGGEAAGAPDAGVPQKQSSLQGGGINRLTQNITAPNSQMAARRAQREQNRAIRLAQARALHDLGSLT
jgi:hypothetical protein